MIFVDTRLFGDPSGIPIGSQELGLHNPYRLGDQDPQSLAQITNNEQIQAAYRSWLLSQIKLQNLVVIHALDDIGYASLDRDITLTCPCRSPHCHGYVIKDVIENKLKEINDG